MGIVEQIADEARMRTMGIQRYRKQQEEAEEKERGSSQGSGASLLAIVVPKLGKELHNSCDLRKRKTGPIPEALPILRSLPPKVSALVCVRTVFDGLAQRRPLTQTLSLIGSRIEDELKLRAFKRQHIESYRNAKYQIEGSQSYGYQRRVMLGLMAKCEYVVMPARWGSKTRVKVGSFMLNLLMGCSNIVEMVWEHHSKTLKATDAMLNTLALQDTFLEGLFPWYMPTTDPPKPWVTSAGGAYHSWEIPIVKGGRSPKHLGEEVMQPSRVLTTSLNALQDTPWRINLDVLEVMTEMWKLQHRPLPGIPAREPEMEPTRPDDLPFDLKASDMDEVQTEMLLVHKRNRAKWLNAEMRRSSKLLTISQVLNTAREYLGIVEFYFPYQLDWRGRCYTMPLYLSPQGPDPARGLLEFHEGKPFCFQSAVEWFLIAGATHFGVDKVSMRERIDWVAENEAMILLVADDPLSYNWWTEAEEGWQFLAWCLEYGRWHDMGKSLDFVSHTTVGQDGSCNGLQHFSALLRDERGGAAVNLVPADEPQDIYSEVLELVKGKLVGYKREWAMFEPGECDAPTSRMARQWLKSGLLDRKIVKRQVMTLPYGATRHGMQTMLMDYLKKVRSEGVEIKLEKEWDCGIFLTELIHESINEVVVAANAVMEWLQECARKVAEAGLPLRWTTPHGFEVVQAYRSRGKDRVKTHICGEVRLILRPFKEAIDRKKQVSGISPNFIHSLDACHLLETVVACKDSQATLSWAVVHDSYGCHAADAPFLAETLREEFVRLYMENDPLEQWRLDIERDTGIMLPDPPPKGQLEIFDVLKSTFFFA
jgi:DNA-directed RNA polymerase